MNLHETFPLYISNSLTRQKEVFNPINPGHVGLYVCGPTVYSYVHLGNVRTFLTFDVLYRYLRFIGYKVRYVRNITDVGHLVDDADSGEDKIAKKARLENLEPMEVVQMYTNDFHEVLRTFNFIDPSIEPSATGHIIEQIEMVKRILDNGFAYEVNGSVYFDVLKFQSAKGGYGELSGRVLEDLISNTRELDGQDEKRNSLDFAIWKKAEAGHIMKWPSPWGMGFPGWHLECSVMSTKYLGETFDIHGGGMDLKFPHHECEIAQSVAADGQKPVNYWMHSNMLTVNGQKMSKSLGNSFSPRELITGDHALLNRGYGPMTVRFFMLQSHYSSTLDFSNDALEAAEKGYKRLMNALASLHKLEYKAAASDDKLNAEVQELLNDLLRNLSDDLNTAKAIADLFELSSKINSFANGQLNLGSLSEETFTLLKDRFTRIITEVLGLLPEQSNENSVTDDLVKLFIELRQDARKNKDFATSDKIRDDLAKIGVTLKDGPEGTSFSLN
ncbi:MAG: cysteine--tRNA ligase [Bacteroidetes bacterium]|nr:MAG: cysteine--tRNA ligase [Bacteroidota bacterium]